MTEPISETRRAVHRLAAEQELLWLELLAAATRVAARAEDFGGIFAGKYVLDELGETTGNPRWRPGGLRKLVSYGLLVKEGESTRGGRRAYYRMPEREEVERGLADVGAYAPTKATMPAPVGTRVVLARAIDEFPRLTEGVVAEHDDRGYQLRIDAAPGRPAALIEARRQDFLVLLG
jgi:hypothetical protein